MFNGFKSGELFIHTIYLRYLFTHTHAHNGSGCSSQSIQSHTEKDQQHTIIMEHDHPWELNQTFNDGLIAILDTAYLCER